MRYSRVPAGRCMILSMISSAVCVPTGRSQAGQCGWPSAGNQDPQIVVNLGDGADRAAGRVAGVLLLDGDGRREALDVVQPRLLHLVDELPGVGTEALHVAPLAFGINRVHGQRGLAAAAGPAADSHLVAGNLHVDPLEIMLPSAADFDRLGELGTRGGTGRGDRRGDSGRRPVSPRSPCLRRSAAGRQRCNTRPVHDPRFALPVRACRWRRCVRRRRRPPAPGR